MKIRCNVVHLNDLYGVQFWIGEQGFELRYLSEDKADALWMAETITKALEGFKKAAQHEIMKKVRDECFQYSGNTKRDRERKAKEMDESEKLRVEGIVLGMDCIFQIVDRNVPYIPNLNQ